MSLSLGIEGQAALQAIEACDRLVPKLAGVIAHHEHAAAVAEPDWSGPHHETFADRFASVQRTLEAGRIWVLHVRREAEARLAALEAEVAEAAAALDRAVSAR